MMSTGHIAPERGKVKLPTVASSNSIAEQAASKSGDNYLPSLVSLMALVLRYITYAYQQVLWFIVLEDL
jgi:hypothetical protein